MRVASRACAISASVLVRAGSNTTSSATTACGSAALSGSARSHGSADRPAMPILAPRVRPARAARADTTSAAPCTRVPGHCSAARSASHTGVTTSCTSSPGASTAADAPSALKPVSTVTGLGFSMKCAPSWMAIRRSSPCACMAARMAASRSSNVMRWSQNSSDPAASPRSVSSNRSSSFGMVRIRPCW